jgi:pimeloyl-ACP methyl ester carboxylesterase
MRRPLSLARILKRFAAAAASLYLLACLALFAMQRSMVFNAHPLQFEPDAQGIAIPTRGLTLHGWVLNPGRAEALIYFGGKGESVERDVASFRRMFPCCSVYVVPYRGFGPNAGSPTEADLFADALVVHDWVRAHHERVSAMGRSLGTGVAAWLASQRPIDKLVLVTPYDSVLNIARERYPIFPVAWFLQDLFESWRYAGSIRAKSLVVIADDDQTVPRAHSDNLIAHFAIRPDVVVVPHAGHNNVINSPVYAPALGNFMCAPAQVPSTSPAPAR